MLINNLHSNAATLDGVDLAQSEEVERNDAGLIGEKNLKYLKFDNKKDAKEQTFDAPGQSPKVGGSGAGASFVLKEVVLVDNTAVEHKDINYLIVEYIDEVIDFKTAEKIAEKLTRYYKHKGYLTSFAYIPPQRIKNGILKIRIAENKIGQLQIKNNKWVRSAYIRKNFLKPQGIKTGELFDFNKLSSSIKSINETPNLKVDTSIYKGIEPGTTDVKIDVKDRMPIYFAYTNSNNGSDVTGRSNSNFTLRNYNVTGYGDSFTTSATLSDRTWGTNLSYTIPLLYNDTNLTIGYGVNKVYLGKELKESAIRGLSHSLNATIDKELFASNTFRLSSDLTFSGRNSDTKIFSNQPYSKYSLRTISAGLSAIKHDSMGNWSLRVNNTVGLPILGASSSSFGEKIQSSYGQESTKFYKLNMALSRIQRLPFDMYAVINASTQYTPDTLLSPMRMSLGGSTTVRGFEEGLLIGDVGYNFSCEVNAPMSFLPEVKIPFLPEKYGILYLNRDLLFHVFYDQGYAQKIHDKRSGTHENFLQSVGFGFKYMLSKYLSVNIDFGVPLGRKRDEKQNDMDVHFYLRSNIY